MLKLQPFYNTKPDGIRPSSRYSSMARAAAHGVATIRRKNYSRLDSVLNSQGRLWRAATKKQGRSSYLIAAQGFAPLDAHRP